MRTGTELWVKVFSPKVGGVEVVQRAEKKVRRARLFYMRFVAFPSMSGIFDCLGWGMC